MRRVVWDGVSNATLAHLSLAMEGRSSEGDRQRTDSLELSKDRHGVSSKQEKRKLKLIDQEASGDMDAGFLHWLGSHQVIGRSWKNPVAFHRVKAVYLITRVEKADRRCYSHPSKPRSHIYTSHRHQQKLVNNAQT
jgi:hypothetical protein